LVSFTAKMPMGVIFLPNKLFFGGREEEGKDMNNTGPAESVCSFNSLTTHLIPMFREIAKKPYGFNIIKYVTANNVK
jgi:hypothetical protein